MKKDWIIIAIIVTCFVLGVYVFANADTWQGTGGIPSGVNWQSFPIPSNGINWESVRMALPNNGNGINWQAFGV